MKVLATVPLFLSQ